MQLKNIEGSRFKLQASGGKAEHIMGLEKAVGSLSTTEDLILHCKNNAIIRTNKMVLLFSSKLFSKLVTETCSCPSALSQEYDIICPDYDPDCMARVLELITTGVTILDNVAFHVYEGMLFILDSLQINIKLGEIWSNAPTTNLKIQNARTADHDSSSLYISSQNEKRKSYNCKICDTEFHLLFGLQKHMKQHASLSRTEDSGTDMTDTDQEVELSNGDLNLETTVSVNLDIEEVDLSTLVHSSPTNEIDKNSLFFCHECSKEVSNFEAFEKHMNNHFMEIENKSTASTSPTQKNLAGIIIDKGLFINFVMNEWMSLFNLLSHNSYFYSELYCLDCPPSLKLVLLFPPLYLMSASRQ